MVDAKLLLLQIGTIIKCQSVHNDEDTSRKLKEIKSLIAPKLLAVPELNTDLSHLRLDDFADLQIQTGELKPARYIEL